MGFKTIKENGIVVRCECSVHGVFEVESEGLVSFRKRKGFQYRCRACENYRKKKYRQENREAIREQGKKYHQKNKEAIREYKKKYRQENRETILEYKKKYRQENREALLEYGKKRYQENREARREYGKKYYHENKEAVRKYKKKYRQENRDKRNKRDRERRKTDAQYKITRLLRERFRDVLSNKTTEEMLGCSYEFVVSHLGGDEEKILSGEYHIDHIYPLSRFAFDETDGDHNGHKQVAFNWRNLQLLTSEDNIVKANKLDHPTQTRAVLTSFQEIGFKVGVRKGMMVVKPC